MAIKASNQITFTEQKKIVNIKEWYLATNKNTGISTDTAGWTEEVQAINETKQYLWNYEEVVYSIGPSEKSAPVIIGFYGKGTDGKGISDINNYYLITQVPELPENQTWSGTVLMLTPENKYLWNYDEIIYTDGTSKASDPAIIGVYGDSGADAVDFQIYSVDGFEFSESVTSIALKTVAFQNGEVINSNVSYQWMWWNRGSTLDDKYEIISGETSSTLIVDVEDPYAFASLKCEMTYDNIVYEDHISLSKQATVYTAVAKFFNGNNVITNDNDYIIAYIELYKNNTPEEQLYSDKVYVSDANVVQNNIIVTDIDGEYADEDMVYFVCKNTSGNSAVYNVVLGKYSSSQWDVVDNKYIYNNDLYSRSTSNVVFIPKEKVHKSLNINFEVCSEKTIVARTNTIVLDVNDPIVSSTVPTNPKEGQLWLDMSISPSILKMWDGTEWVNSGYQNGNTIYTTQPNEYLAGDIWILSEEDEDLFGKLCAGTMLKATVASSVFDMAHWMDVDQEATSQKKNIKQYFLFNANTGLRIGQSDDKFYVNISSTRMSFCENPLIQSSSTDEIVDPNEVVSISNQSAKIKNLTVEDGATFNCEIKLWDFVLTRESNGSLSLSI